MGKNHPLPLTEHEIQQYYKNIFQVLEKLIASWLAEQTQTFPISFSKAKKKLVRMLKYNTYS